MKIMNKDLLYVNQGKLMDYALKYYKIAMGKKCDIHNPTLFTEKVLWYTYFYDNPICPYIVDKVTFKQYINNKLGEGYTIPMFGSWTSVDEFEKAWFSDILPNEFCLKANLQSDGRNIKMIHDKKNTDFSKIKKEVIEWLKPENTLMNSLARNFYMSEPRILAEQYMSNFMDQLYDYKFFCFNGRPFCIYVAQDHFGKEGSHISFYDLNWNKMNVRYGNHLVGEAPCPKHFEDMIDISKTLSREFPFLRVDFFDTDDKLFIAELTFNPGGGFVPYYPESFNKELGDLFILPINNNHK